MDPDVCLHRIRALVTALDNADFHAYLDDPLGGERGPDPDDVRELTHSIAALDEWIAGGGFLPNAWRRERMSARAKSYAEAALECVALLCDAITLECLQPVDGEPCQRCAACLGVCDLCGGEGCQWCLGEGTRQAQIVYLVRRRLQLVRGKIA